MTSVADLIEQIDRYCAAKKMAPSTLGRLALGDPSFVGRLRRGSECFPSTAERVFSFMQKNPPEDQEEAAA